MGECGSGVACPCELELDGDGGQRRKRKREGARDCGGSYPIYRLEGLEAKQMSSGGGRTGLEALGGEVALRMAGWRVKRPSVQGHVCAGGEAKGQSRCPWRALLGQVGRGRAMDEVHRRRTGGRRRNREGDGDRNLSVIF